MIDFGSEWVEKGNVGSHAKVCVCFCFCILLSSLTPPFFLLGLTHEIKKHIP